MSTSHARGAAPRVKGSKQLGTANSARTQKSDHDVRPGVITERHRGPCRPPRPMPPKQHIRLPQRTRRAHARVAHGAVPGAVPHGVAWPLAHTAEQPWPSHWLWCSQVRERATSENGLAGLARAPGALAHTPPHLRSVAHTAHALAPHITEVWLPSRRQGGAVEEPQSDAMDVDTTMEVRPHAPAHPHPTRVAPWPAPHTAAHEPLHALTP